jgi:hypothetical protein
MRALRRFTGRADSGSCCSITSLMCEL